MTNREMAARMTEEELNNLIADIRRGMWGTRHVLALLGQFELLRAELAIASEYHNDEETFEQLWIGYAMADDDTLDSHALELKRKLRKIVGIDELSADLTATNEALQVTGKELATVKKLLGEAVEVEMAYRDQRDEYMSKCHDIETQLDEARRERDVAREVVDESASCICIAVSALYELSNLALGPDADGYISEALCQMESVAEYMSNALADSAAESEPASRRVTPDEAREIALNTVEEADRRRQEFVEKEAACERELTFEDVMPSEYTPEWEATNG